MKKIVINNEEITLNFAKFSTETLNIIKGEIEEELFARKERFVNNALDELKIELFFNAEEITCMAQKATNELRKIADDRGWKSSISNDSKRKNASDFVKEWRNKLARMYTVCKRANEWSTMRVLEELAKLELTYEQKKVMMNCFNDSEYVEKKKEPPKYYGDFLKVWEMYPDGEKPTYEEIKAFLEYTRFVEKTEEEIAQERREQWISEDAEKENVEYAGTKDTTTADILNEINALFDR